MNLQVHRHTPSLKVNDGRGLPIRHVEYLRKVIDGPVETLVTRQIHDPIGRLIAQWDPRLFGTAPKPNISTVHGLSGNALRVDGVDAGKRLNLTGVAGQALQRWDGRGCHWQTDYDNQLRVTALHEQPPGQPQTIVERIIYADHSADSGHNLRGQKTALEDPAGRLDVTRFSLLGAPLSETRTFLDGKACTTSWHYSANGAELTRTDAAGHRQHTRFDLAGQLKQSFLQLKDDDSLQPVLRGLTYNAFNQTATQTTGNGVVRTWTYHPADGRLTSQTAGVPGQSLLQNLSYHYDRMGNILRIEDHGFKPVFFANQRIDGDREFAYDSLYRLTWASGFEAEKPNLQPGLPDLITPIDPARRFNYTEHYHYDHGNNPTTVCHRRDGNNFTRQMRIDEHSNRGVRWEEGDPEPIFDELFDPNGNLLLLQRGQPLNWNARDQLAKVTLLEHSNGLSDDEEIYVYSQGVRVYKHHVWHTPSATHSQEVLYLPGLEIRTCSDGQQLHVITLSTGAGSVRCLHWVVGKPTDIEPDQLRYHLGDHLDSIALELDRDGVVISHEAYYPFGGTCWWAAISELEANYKTIRYSGKELDVSGLYYHGVRYYAPWLLHWISADPGGDVDGLNLYAFVGNNPLAYIDLDGGMRTPKEMAEQYQQWSAKYDDDLAFNQVVYRHLELLSLVKQRTRDAEQQILNHRSPDQHALSSARRTGTFLAGQGASYATSMAVGAVVGAAGGPPGMLVGAGVGFVVGKVVSLAFNHVAETTGASASVKLKNKRIDPDKLLAQVKSETGGPVAYVKNVLRSFDPRTDGGKRKLAKEIYATTAGKAPIVGTGMKMALAASEILHEVNGAGKELTEEKTNTLDTHLENLALMLDRGMTRIEAKFEATGRETSLGYTPQALRQKTNKRIRQMNDTQSILRSSSSRFTAV
ncbi:MULTISPECIES: RHS repeat-associated core domain-containing protein [unclassified Pseudomonas]|uniref:RHS repeat-associated core domain-containing protein n=1 Tax=unclassified Pseudomonas TaxID=196821 RepID=UPI000CD1386F|nr:MULTISPECIES: RHS repeat-associated core domain-containing protein [unclassified Pseudomonas]POA34478.1 hypothetical protein C1887_04535 [Pseudomonas sp. GW456-R21]POA70548.1 hypothetical protein C1884_04110 [Pseudomonas sp. GW460-R15]